MDRSPAAVARAAAGVFGERIGLAERYAELLAGPGVDRGLIGPREGERLWERHLLNSAALASALAAGTRVIDVGSGAGLPGIPIAIARPDVHVTLLEPMERRVAFLNEAVQDVGLENVEVRRGRAEERGDALPGPADVADAVVCRAVAPLARLVEWAVTLAPRGVLLALKGASVLAEVRDAEPVLRRLGVQRVDLVTFAWNGGNAAALRPQVHILCNAGARTDLLADVDDGVRRLALSGMLATAVRVDLADRRGVAVAGRSRRSGAASARRPSSQRPSGSGGRGA